MARSDPGSLPNTEARRISSNSRMWNACMYLLNDIKSYVNQSLLL